MRGQLRQLQELIEPAVSAVGFELLGVEYMPSGKHSVLRIFIDGPDGVTVDDCGRVSHQVSGILDVEDPIRGQYLLEVSSPGLDRPLFKAEHFRQFIGSPVKLKLDAPLDGRRKLKGILLACEDDRVLVEAEGEEYSIPLEAIGRANLIADVGQK